MSYFLPIPISSIKDHSGKNHYLELIKGRYRLSTDLAVYSFDDLYDNFYKTFKAIHIEKLSGQEVLILGGGLGSIIYMLEKKFRIKAKYSIVESNPTIVKLYYKVNQNRINSPVKVIQKNAFDFIASINDKKYHTIIIDVFIDDLVPIEFSQLEFINNISSSLNRGGIALFNWMKSDRLDEASFVHFYNDVWKHIFPNGTIFHTKYNYILLSDASYLKSNIKK